MTISLALLISSCNKIVQIAPPKNQLVSSTVFADSLGANAAINGIYVNMMQVFSLTFANGGITLYTGLAGDELYQSKNNAANAEFYNNAITISNSVNSSLWSSAYKYIYDANACIAGVNGSAGISTSAKRSLSAEAMFIRAFVYFNLVHLYGDVPLVLTTDYNTTGVLPRSAVNSVYAQVVADLKFAQANLPAVNGNNTRAGSFAATALLAKVYLYEGLYTQAITESEKIIGSGNYALVQDPNGVFLAGSTETIWSFAPVSPGKDTWEGYFFVPSSASATPAYIIANSLYNAFEPGDLRKADWINASVVKGQAYPYPYKYKTGLVSGSPPENYVVLRLADQYLIDAEARASNGDLAGALVKLNVIRHRAGLPDVESTNKTSVLAAIAHERQAEFFCEWGNRWFDMNRSGRADAVFGAEKPGWKSTSGLFPIPQAEINANPYLTQNPGY